jgi:GDP-mannose 6-dehydrogenase
LAQFSAGCLANDGHCVVGVDPVSTKVELINRGASPIIEADMEGITAGSVTSGKLRAMENPSEAIEATELSLVYAGTPS